MTHWPHWPPTGPDWPPGPLRVCMLAEVAPHLLGWRLDRAAAGGGHSPQRHGPPPGPADQRSGTKTPGPVE